MTFGVAYLDGTFIRVPFEQSRRTFRNELKVVDRDLSTFSNDSRGDEATQEAKMRKAQKLEAIIEKLRKYRNETRLYNGRFVDRGSQLSIPSSEGDTEGIGQSNTRSVRFKVNRAIFEYLFQANLPDSATAFHQFMQFDADLELYLEMERIKIDLRNRRATSCLSWCSENRAHLKKNSSPLEFLLRRQEFIELTRIGDLVGAISYARKHFPQFSDTHEVEIEQAMALLAIQPHTSTTPYCWLHDLGRWDDLVLLYDRENRNLHGILTDSQLSSLAQAGMVALKTMQCGKNCSLNCPACNDPLKVLASKVPFAHHDTSILVCSATGMSMDADNIPMALPNGHVYSKKFIEESASKNNGFIICPRSNQKFKSTEIRKCYIS